MISAAVVVACRGVVLVAPSFLTMSAIEHIEVVASVLSAMDAEGPELARVGEEQSKALCTMLSNYKKITPAEKLALVGAIRGLRMGGVAKNRLLERVNGIYVGGGSSRKRPLQDYHSWPNFGTRLVWQELFENPALATEVVCQHLNSLGLICPSETTCVSIAAHIRVAELGPMAASISRDDAKITYKAVKKRLKQLYTSEPGEYIEKLPASPSLLVSQYPITSRVFSRDRLPTACPLNPMWVSSVVAKLNCRDRPGASQPAGADAIGNGGMGQMMIHMMQQFQQFMRHPHQDAQAHQNKRLRIIEDRQEPSAGAVVLTNLKINLTSPKKAKQVVLALGDFEAPSAAPNTPAAAPAAAPKTPVAALAAAPNSPLASSVLDQGGAATDNGNTDMRSKVLGAHKGILADRKEVADLQKAANKKIKAAAAEGDKGTPPKWKQSPKKKLKQSPKKNGKPSSAALHSTMMKSVMKRPSAKPNKQQSWIKARPNGCSKCRHRPGCTPSCYTSRGEKMPV
jgi:hypothetical protein